VKEKALDPCQEAWATGKLKEKALDPEEAWATSKVKEKALDPCHIWEELVGWKNN
jgi:hypothetical protein